METVAMNMKITVATERRATGSVLPAGCSRTTATQLRAVVFIRSAASASESPRTGT
jgi:hypothetical protein